MHDVVTKLRKAFSAVTPPINPNFAPPASSHEVEEAEFALNLSFPPELIELLLSVNGQLRGGDEASDPIFPMSRFGPERSQFSGGGWLLNVQDIVEQTLSFREYVADTRDTEHYTLFGPTNFHDRFIILSESGNPESLALDLQPSAGGTVGQVVAINDQPNNLAVLSPNLRSFLTMIAEGYLIGRFVYGEVFQEAWSDR